MADAVFVDTWGWVELGHRRAPRHLDSASTIPRQARHLVHRSHVDGGDAGTRHQRRPDRGRTLRSSGNGFPASSVIEKTELRAER